MPYINYIKHNFHASTLAIVDKAEEICAQYQAMGYDLTLRQLYYQFVARDLLKNDQKEYKRLGDIVNNARMAGLLDWDFIVDRTRNLQALSSWRNPEEILESALWSYKRDHWVGQDTRLEVWVEKDALAGVIDRACSRWDVPYFSCRGYTSQSEMWGAAQRIGRIQNGMRNHVDEGFVPQSVVILHLGDHDPSGIDMTRDIADRLRLFTMTDFYHEAVRNGRELGSSYPEIEEEMNAFGHNPVEVRRIALNWDQIEEYAPPPNPAKLTDSRSEEYIANFGHQSWELDALEPNVLDTLISETIEEYVDMTTFQAVLDVESNERGLIAEAIDYTVDGLEDE